MMKRQSRRIRHNPPAAVDVLEAKAAPSPLLKTVPRQLRRFPN